MAAFQSLGPFISTFADPAKTGLYYTDGGLIVLDDGKDGGSESSGSTDSGCSTDSHHSNDESFVPESSPAAAVTTSSTCSTVLLPSYVHSLSLRESSPGLHSCSNVMIARSEGSASRYPLSSIPSSARDGREDESLFRSSFSAFQFWRIPISDPSFDPEISCIDVGSGLTTTVAARPVAAATDGSPASEASLSLPVGLEELPVQQEEGLVATGDEEEAMVIDPLPLAPPPPPALTDSQPRDDCRPEANNNSLEDDQEASEGSEEKRRRESREEGEDDGEKEEPNQSQDREKTSGSTGIRGLGDDDGGRGQITRRQMRDEAESLSRTPAHLVSGPGDEAEMRDQEIEEEQEVEDDDVDARTQELPHPPAYTAWGPPDGDLSNSPASAISSAQPQGLLPPPPQTKEGMGFASGIVNFAAEQRIRSSSFPPDAPADADCITDESMDQEECETAVVTVRNTLPDAPPATCDPNAKSLVASTSTSTTSPATDVDCHNKRSSFLTFFSSNDQDHTPTGPPPPHPDLHLDSGSLSSVLSGANCQRILNQESIPSDLLKHFLSMTSQVNYETVDHELSHYCAYSFPAVAMTLGRKHWPCLMSTYESLAADVQWKVRLTLASSLHQMAVILGPKYTSRDLIPIFFQFMTDFDEVRFGILQNLSSIMRLLNRNEQLSVLPRIVDFLRMDNPRNWRFRRTLAEQVSAIAPLFSPPEIKDHLLPIAYTLLKDKVSDVRLSAIQLLSTLMRHFFCDTSLLPLRLTPPPPFPASCDPRHDVQKPVPPLVHEEDGTIRGNKSNDNNNSPASHEAQDDAIPGTETNASQSMGSPVSSPSDKSAVGVGGRSRTSSTNRLPLDQVSLELISELTALVRSPKWVFRQAFVFLCEQMITDQSLPVQVFDDHFFDCLMSLKGDRVTNVRLALSRCVQRSIHGNVMFHGKQEAVMSLLMELANDPDSDVRRFARLVVHPSLLQDTSVNPAYMQMMVDFEAASSGASDHQASTAEMTDVFRSSGSSSNNNNISEHGSNTGPTADNSSSNNNNNCWLTSSRLSSLIPQQQQPRMRESPAYPQPPPPPFPSSVQQRESVTQVLVLEEESVIEADADAIKDANDEDVQSVGSIIPLNRVIDSHSDSNGRPGNRRRRNS